MKKIFIVIALIMLYNSHLHSQLQNKTVIQRNDEGIVCMAKFAAGNQDIKTPVSASDFFQTYLKMKSEDTFEKHVLKSHNPETSHEVYEQFYKGIRVASGSYVFHYKNGRITRIRGEFIPIDDLNTTPSITKEEAMLAFAKYKGIPRDSVLGFSSELLIISPFGQSVQQKRKPVLAYKIYLDVNHFKNDEVGYIDAHKGSVISTARATASYSTYGYFETRYNNNVYAYTSYYNNKYHLADSIRDAIISTWDLNGNSSPSYKQEILDNDNNWSRMEHYFSRKYVAFDVYWALQKIYDALYFNYSRSSYDDNGAAITAYINYYDASDERCYDNAMYDLSENAIFVYRDTVNYGPMASLDMIAHEFGHGINNYNTKWKDMSFNNAQTFFDQKEMLYLDEGLCDIWAVILKYKITNSTNGIWQIGADVAPGVYCLRNIEYPNVNCNLMSTAYHDSNYIGGYVDPHISGCVFSRWFYLLAMGGSGVNSLNKYYNIDGIGLNNAAELVVNAIYEGYLYETINYNTVREAFIDVAEDMNMSGLVDAVCNAWYAVGVGGMNLSISGPDVICDEGVYTVEGLPSGYTVEWLLSDSDYNDYCMETDTPSTNQCTITKDDYGSMVDATLTAYIKYNGAVVQTVTKTGISAYNDIIGHYTSGSISDAISYTHILPVLPGYNTIILSPVLIGATVSYSTSATIPLYWGFSPYSGEIDVTMPYNSVGRPIVFNIYDACGNYYNLYLYSQSQYLINISNDDNAITISLNENSESTKDLRLDEPWTIEICNVLTGELMTTCNSTSRSATILTAGWQKGMYVIKVTVGKESWNAKFVKK